MLRRAFLTGLFAAFLTASTVFAGEITFFGTTDKNPLEYEPGEKMTFSVQCLEDGAAVSGKKLTWTRTGDDGKTEKGEAVSDAANPLKIETSIDVPGFVRIQVFALTKTANRSAANNVNSTAAPASSSTKSKERPNRPTSTRFGTAKKKSSRKSR